MIPTHRLAFGRFCLPAVAAAAFLLVSGQARGQFGGGGGFGRSVGGIAIDARGIVGTLDPRAAEELAAERQKALADGTLPTKPGGTRKVSLKAVAAAVRQATTDSTPLPADILFLGGLQRIESVYVDPDRHDIVLSGPAELLKVDAMGGVVGVTSGRPPLHLEDLIVALRAIDAAREGGMTCSIDPTPEGIAKLQTLLRTQGTMSRDPKATFAAMEEAMGPQRVTVTGVPGDSRFARVLVVADYRMKRIGMGLEPSGLAELPSYLAMVQAGGRATMLPRFWLEAEYDPIIRDPDELAWRISGRRMKCLTESDVAGKAGVARGAAPADAIATKWCAAMTDSYDALATKQPIFAELANCVDLAVVAALIRGRQLDDRAGCDLAPFLDPAAAPLPRYEVPTSVPTVATGIKKGSTWVLSASGGVKFQPWQFATTTVESADAASARATALEARPADLAGCSWD